MPKGRSRRFVERRGKIGHVIRQPMTGYASISRRVVDPWLRDGDSFGETEFTADIELDFARQFHDCFGMPAVLEQRVFEGFGPVDEQATIEAVLFLRDPVAAMVLADKNDGRCRATRWRFGELHVGFPSDDEPSARSADCSVVASPAGGLTQAFNILLTGYEFEAGKTAIS